MNGEGGAPPRVLKLLMLLFPRDHREAYGSEMWDVVCYRYSPEAREPGEDMGKGQSRSSGEGGSEEHEGKGTDERESQDRTPGQ